MDWKVGDVIQVDPEHSPTFGGCFMVVSELETWGAQGYVSVPQSDGAPGAYLRLKFESGVKIGTAEWMLDNRED